MRNSKQRGSRGAQATMPYVLWVVQGLLALLFLFAGAIKLLLPLAVLTKQMPLPGLFVRCIGVAEVCGALGLILPSQLRIQTGLTLLAASGLLIVMIGATVFTLVTGGGPLAVIPVVIGPLAAFIAYGHWRLAPHRKASEPLVHRLAS